jgi:molecular chaperone GrpE
MIDGHEARDAAQRPPAERSPGAPAGDDAPPTTQDDAAEPAGEQEAANEAERMDVPEPSDAAAEPEDELMAAQRQRDEYLELAQRTQADFENYRKRAARDAAAAGERAKSGLVRELLPVVDNLERALDSAAGAEGSGDGERPEEHLADGVRLVHSELVAVLSRNGVEVFDPKGDKFDPELHEALSMRSENGCEQGMVLDVVEKGYRLNGAVLRPARVVVCG